MQGPWEAVRLKLVSRLPWLHQLIPFDEMLDTMYQVGKRIPYELRETALGGYAVSPTGCRFYH